MDAAVWASAVYETSFFEARKLRSGVTA